MTAPPDPHRLMRIAILEEAVGRLQEIDALIESIERAELLNEVKGREGPRRRQCAASLLAVLRRELDALASELQSAVCVENIMARITGPKPAD